MQMEGQDWFYTPTVKQHFFKPKHAWTEEKDPKGYDAHGVYGSMKCGDKMEMWIKVKKDRITDLKWKTFGCASAIASTSMLATMVTEKGGMTIQKALKLTPMDIVKRLGGLPAIKIHCSIMGDKALRAAIYDYKEKNKRDDIKVDKPIEDNDHH